MKESQSDEFTSFEIVQNVELEFTPEETSDLNQQNNDKVDTETERETWGGEFEFVLSLVGYTVGLGNLWRFPYFCYKNGGGCAIIPFILFLTVCGGPLYYMEVCLGQWSGTSPITVWNICPLLKGLGLVMVTLSLIYIWYYAAAFSWVIYFLIQSFFPTLPWSKCGNSWNTELCIGTLLQRKKKSVRISKEETLLILRSYREHPTRWTDVVDDVRQNTDRLSAAAQELYRTGSAKQLRDRMSIKLSKLMATRENIEDQDIRQEVELIRAQERRLVNNAQPRQAQAEDQAGRQLADNDVPARPDPVAPPPRAPNQVVAPPPIAFDQDAARAPRAIDQAVAPPLRPNDQPGPVQRIARYQHGSPPRQAGGRNERAQRKAADRDDIAAGLSSDEEANDEPPQRRRRLSDLIRENNELYNDFMKRTVPKLLREYGIDLND